MDKYEFKKLRPENIRVGDLYLMPSNGKIVPVIVDGVYGSTFTYSNLDESTIGAEPFNSLKGFFAMRNCEGELEFHVSEEFLKAMENLRFFINRRIPDKIPQFSSEPELGPSLDL